MFPISTGARSTIRQSNPFFVSGVQIFLESSVPTCVLTFTVCSKVLSVGLMVAEYLYQVFRRVQLCSSAGHGHYLVFLDKIKCMNSLKSFTFLVN